VIVSLRLGDFDCSCRACSRKTLSKSSARQPAYRTVVHGSGCARIITVVMQHLGRDEFPGYCATGNKICERNRAPAASRKRSVGANASGVHKHKSRRMCRASLVLPRSNGLRLTPGWRHPYWLQAHACGRCSSPRPQGHQVARSKPGRTNTTDSLAQTSSRNVT